MRCFIDEADFIASIFKEHKTPDKKSLDIYASNAAILIACQIFFIENMSPKQSIFDKSSRLLSFSLSYFARPPLSRKGCKRGYRLIFDYRDIIYRYFHATAWRISFTTAGLIRVSPPRLHWMLISKSSALFEEAGRLDDIYFSVIAIWWATSHCHAATLASGSSVFLSSILPNR